MCTSYSEACTCFVNFYVFVCLLLGSAQDPVHAKGCCTLRGMPNFCSVNPIILSTP